ncbi:methylenetetrahydrofolate reductase C-terminal domain-containing protein [Actinomycetospora termitidis]|uniref:Methylenetetrahydrofolate reductase n=1 Tax=Actinomycetospora termitidis TaxID=3053470 RepID=A0ABT7M7H6_9PSEU|nr:methylenetetrahydrofolate reductase C-terminal domain-containing protein [Actinomycetospora sp. Odt1-22]MDL5156621.1 methylenetetrahydrofolate reductase C-terminal domain-containing protein [Actinomycetospora sp. Odt1-22]
MITCPKRMQYGPCGGVRPSGACELDEALPCPWTSGTPVLPWDGPEPAAPAVVNPPLVLSDLAVPARDPSTLREVAPRLMAGADAVLVADLHDRADFPPTMLAAQLLELGARPWVTLTCRDRNRVVLEQEVVGLAALGVEGVLCVTGDSRPGSGAATTVGAGATQVFDLDATRLAHLAADAGLVATVSVAPAAPPVDRRVATLAAKQAAGARLVIGNHVASPAVLDAFLTAGRAAGVTLPLIAGVAVYTDVRTARGLAELPGLDLAPEAVQAVLDADDPVEAGISAAVEEARALLAVEGVVGVNLSGVGSSAGWVPAAELKAEVGRRVRAAHGR